MKRLAILAAIGSSCLGFTQTAQAHPPRPIVVAPPILVESPPVIVERPVYIPQPVPAIPVPHACPVYTLDTFARDFRPVEGHHHIQVIHPVTKCPVDVCFDLPCGKLREFDVNRRSIEFDYGRHEVRIIFRLNGTVDVKSN
jgi:hypothetical protein